MSEHEHMDAVRDCGVDAAAYVLGALEPTEAAAFEHHMESCVVCRDEVGALTHVVGALPMAAPQHRAPRAVRRRVMRTVRTEARRARAAGPEHGWSAPGFRPAFAGAGALAIVVAALVLALGGGGGHGVRVIPAHVVGSQATAEIRLAGGRADLVVHHLASPTPGHVYEVWLQRGTSPPSRTTALFSVTRSGSANVAVPGDLSGVTRILVTREPAGGSQSPTSAPVIVAQLS